MAGTDKADKHYANSTARIADQGNVPAGWICEDNDTGSRFKRTTSGWNPVVTEGIVGSSSVLLTDATATGTAYSTQLAVSDGTLVSPKATYYATLGANDLQAATATVKVYGSYLPMASAGTDKIDIGTLTLSGTGDTDNDTVVSTDYVTLGENYFPYVWAEVTAITGTGAKVQARRMI